MFSIATAACAASSCVSSSSSCVNAAAVLLGEIQVSERDAAQHDRHTEKRPHGRVVRRKADRPRVLAEILEPQRLRVAYQHAEDPPSSRQVADRSMRLRVDAVRQEALEARACLVDDAQGRVARARELRSGLDELL